MNELELKQWKDIPGYEGKYQVSDIGNIRSLDRMVRCKGNAFKMSRGRIISQSIGRAGYKHVKVEMGKTFFVHRIVMLAFVGQSELQVNHKNGIKTDNRLENLEYVTCSGNAQHAFDAGLKRKVGVMQYDKSGKLISVFDSIRDASIITGAHKSSISRASRGIAKTTKGFIWKLS